MSAGESMKRLACYEVLNDLPFKYNGVRRSWTVFMRRF